MPSIQDLREQNPGYSDAELLDYYSQYKGWSTQDSARYLGVSQKEYASIMQESQAISATDASNQASSYQEYPPETGTLPNPSNAYEAGGALGALVAMSVAGVVGYFLYKLVTPKGPVAAPRDIARAWLGWGVLGACVTMLSRFFIYQNVDAFAMWLVSVMLWGGGAYGLGYIYGKHKLRRVIAAVSNTDPPSPIVNQAQGAVAPVTPPHSVDSPATYNRQGDDSVFARVADELESGNTDKGLWTRLWAECGGDDTKTRVQYIKHRAEALVECPGAYQNAGQSSPLDR